MIRLFFLPAIFFCVALLLPVSYAHAQTLIGDVRVVDGDTIAFDGLGVTVRLEGIDAPESRQACETAAGERHVRASVDYGQAASSSPGIGAAANG